MSPPTHPARQMRQSWAGSPLAWSVALSIMAIALPALYLQAQAAIKYVAFFILQAAVAALLLEIVNYLEHYGLQRRGGGGWREALGVMHRHIAALQKDSPQGLATA